MLKFKKTIAFISAAVMASGCIAVSAADIDITQMKKADGFRYVVENGEVVIIDYDDTREPEEVIPSEIDGMPVTRINHLWGNTTEIIIPDSVKTIDAKAFKGNHYLKKVVIPESVTEIGEYVLSECESLETCEIGASITEIPKGAFFGCEALSELTYPDSIESMGAVAFSGCKSIKEISILDSMTELPDGLFGGCSSLESITLPEGLVKIGNNTFKDCSTLTQIIIPEGVEYIGEYAFAGCSSVTAFKIPEKVNVISDGLFSGCTSLTELTLPEYGLSYEENNTTRIYCRSTFENCSSLTEIILPYGIQNIGANCFDGCTSLKMLAIPETVRIIDDYAFRNCSSLEEIVIPEYSSIYGNETFAGCSSLEGLIIPDTVYSFAGGGTAKGTFKGCTNLKKLYLPATAHDNIDSFDGCDSLEEIYIGYMKGYYLENHFGYIYDEETDTYTKNENLTIYCRDGSDVQKYAEEQGFECNIIEGVQSYLEYFVTYDDEEDAAEKTILKDYAECSFINGEGEYRVSDSSFTLLDDGTNFKGLQNTLLLAVNLGFDNETFSHISAFPTRINFDGTDLSEVYDNFEYDTVFLDNGYWYLIIQCTSNEDNDVTAKEIKGRKINVGFVVDEIVVKGEEPDYILGDVNGDGVVNAKDLVALKKYLLNTPDKGDIVRMAADINGDGQINVVDFIKLKTMML